MTSKEYVVVDEIPYSNQVIEKNNGGFDLFIFINNKKSYVGSFPSKNVAEIIGGLLFKNKWDFSYFDKNNIFCYDNHFFVFKNYENEKIIFLGDFKSFVDASKELNDFNDDEGFIVKKNKKFFVKRFNTTYGKFDSLSIVKFVRDKLKYNYWDINYFDDHNIFKYRKSYIILKLDDLYIRFFKYFKSEKKAREALEDFNDYLKKLFKEMYIDFQAEGYKFAVKDNSGKIYGRFSSLISSKMVKDILIKNNWDLEYLKNNPIEFFNRYFVFNIDDNDEIVSYFTFRSKNRAEEILNDNSTYKKSNFKNNKFVIERDNEVLAELSSENDYINIANILNYYDVSYLKNNIIQYGEYYYVFKVSDDKIISFYKFLSKNESQLMFEIMEEMTMDFISDNIYSKDDKCYIVANKAILGVFDFLDHAEFVRDILSNIDWDINFFNKNNIFENNDKFLGFKLIGDRISFIDEFDSYDEAFEILNPDSRIENKDGKFELIRIMDDGNEVSFGTFSTLVVANILKDILRKNNWDVNYFKKNNIFDIDGINFVFKLRNSNVLFIGSYSNYGDAEKSINDYYIYNENDMFVVCNDLKIVGTYDDEDVAIIVKETLNENSEYFYYNEIVHYDGMYYGFLIKNNQIQYIGCSSNHEEILNLVNEEKSNVTGIQFLDYFIEKEDDEFNLYRNTKKIGSFEDEDIANFAKKTLTNNYPEYFIDTEITFKGGKFYTFKIIDNMITFLGSYFNRSEALESLEIEPDVIADYDNIKFVNEKYVVFRDDKDIGIFNTPDEAIRVHDILIEHNWNKKYFLDYNIFTDVENGIIHVFKLNEDMIISLGVFKSIVEANEALKNFIG